jgi:hypothetical protein
MERSEGSFRKMRLITIRQASICSHSRWSRVELFHFPITLNFWLQMNFFSASSYYPGHGQEVPHFFTHPHAKNEGRSDSNHGDANIESEEEWLSVTSGIPILDPNRVNNFL